MRFANVFGMAVILMAFTHSAMAVSPNADEMLTAHKWTSNVFSGVVENTNRKPGLEVIQNWGRVQKNTRFGKPMQVAGIRYERGIFCHAPSRILVRLPGPVKAFSATLGVDDAVQWDVRDYQSGPLWPEVVFSLKSGDKEIYKSAVITGRGAPAVPITTELNGISEFTMEVAGSKFADWGDAEWINAKVTLVDGREIWLDELPMPITMVDSSPDIAPFSFTYGKRKSTDLLKGWDLKRSSRNLDDRRVEHTLLYTDPDTNLTVRCVGITYSSYPTVEWTVYLKNNGKSDTPLIKDLKALDMSITREADDEFVLHHNMGSSCRIDDFKPIKTILNPNMKKRFAPATGYSSDPDMPYFNIQLPGGEGLIVAVGWPGQWAAEFTRDSDKGLSISAGQETSRFKLHPGEEVRTPLIALQFYRGDWNRSQNIWRRWMMAYNVPKPGGKMIEPMNPGQNADVMQFTNTTEENQKQFIDRYAEEKVGINWWWIDYGWHEGTWTPDKKRFPNGLKPVTDYAKERGIKTIVWFAPEHAPNGGDPTWLLQAPGKEPLSLGSTLSVIDLGNPVAWKWITDMVDARIKSEGISCYRHDTAFGPLLAWKAHDTKDREGITENHYVTGFLAYYDELLKRNPGLLIDNCCRGGRRLDLETSRRSVCLWRSDWATEPIGQQSMTYGLSTWLPFFGTGTSVPDIYILRSLISPCTNFGYDMRIKELDYDLIRRFGKQWWEIAPNLLGDFYPLTPYTTDTGAWMAWQYDRPEAGEGIIQVFRRDGEPRDSTYSDSMYVKLKGLVPDAVYTLVNFDVDGQKDVMGRELMDKGIFVEAPKPPTALIFKYDIKK